MICSFFILSLLPFYDRLDRLVWLYILMNVYVNRMIGLGNIFP